MEAARTESAYRWDADHRLIPEADPPVWRTVTIEDVGADLRMHCFDFVAEADHRTRGKGPPTFCLAVFLDGRGTMAIDDGPSLRIEPGTTVLFHTPLGASGENRVVAGSHVRCLDLRCAPETLQDLGMPSPAALRRGFPSDCSVNDVLLVGRPTPAALSAIARDIFACRLQGESRRFYMRAKALEAFAHVIALADRPEAMQESFSRRDQDRIRDAARMLATRYPEPWTIARVARAVGLNDRKLKTGFRQLIGCTVHNYLEDVRLTAAAEMLAAGDSSVTKVAFAVGYNNLSHFAKQFRRRHGLPPRDWPGRA